MVKTEKVVKVGITRETGYLYYVDSEGDISQTKMMRGRKRTERTTKDR